MKEVRLTEKNYNIPRMRTIKKAIEAIRADDPETDFTEHRLRKLIDAGDIPHIERGQRFLVDLNKLYAYLSGEAGQQPAKQQERPFIGKVW